MWGQCPRFSQRRWEWGTTPVPLLTPALETVILLRHDFFSGRVVTFHILIHQLDELGDDVVAL
jgi:hypothetical protein